MWTSMYEFQCFPQIFINRASCSSLEDSSSLYLSPCLHHRKVLDFSLIYEVIHRICRSLLLRLYFYKTSKEQLKTSLVIIKKRSGQNGSEAFNPSVDKGKMTKKGFIEIEARQSENLA